MKEVVKPVRIPIPHSIFSPELQDDTICLFCRSEDKTTLDDMNGKGHSLGVSKILSIDDVKKYYKAFKDRKTLLHEHTYFVCDARVMKQLYNLLGNVFSTRHNYPVPINFDRKLDVASSVRKAVDSTYMHLSGQNIAVRLALTAMSTGHVIENVVSGIGIAVSKLKGGWENVHSIHIKTSDSASLPIYTKLPDGMIEYIAAKTSSVDAASSKSKKSKEKKKNSTPALASTDPMMSGHSVSSAAISLSEGSSIATARKSIDASKLKRSNKK